MSANKKKGLSRAKTAEQLKRELEPDPEILDLRSKVKRLESTIEDMRSSDGKLQSLFRDLGEQIKPIAPEPMYYRPDKETKKVASPISAVLLLSDWHIGMRQEPDEIEGFNEFDHATAVHRVMSQLIPVFVNHVNTQRSVQTINTARVICLGDFISGDIHQELTATNEFPVPVQVVKAADLLATALAGLSRHFKSVIVDYITADNHGRLTKKPQAKEEGLNSFNYLVGFLARAYLAEFDNVAFNFHPQLYKVIKIENMRYLATHGHVIKSWMGIPFYGIERQIGREAQVRLNAPDDLRFHKVILGHFHTPMFNPKYLMGGSLSGTDAYDRQNGRIAGPAQLSWFVHPKHGEYNFTEIRMV